MDPDCFQNYSGVHLNTFSRHKKQTFLARKNIGRIRNNMSVLVHVEVSKYYVRMANSKDLDLTEV